MTDFEKVLMARDGVTREEARKERNRAEMMMYSILEEGGSYSDVEDMMMGDYGLEMDYIMDLM